MHVLLSEPIDTFIQRYRFYIMRVYNICDRGGVYNLVLKSIPKCKNIFIKMLKDVGMAVPETRETREVYNCAIRQKIMTCNNIPMHAYPPYYVGRGRCPPPDWWSPCPPILGQVNLGDPPVLGPVDSPLNRWTPIACMAPCTLFVNSPVRICKRV